MDLHSAPHGLNVVVECEDARGRSIVIGRFDSTNAFQALLHDCDVHSVTTGEDAETYIRQTATYGIAVNTKDTHVDLMAVKRVRLLGEIQKLH
jgi:hypothetical protein